jgi:hypothetical protein
MKVSKLRTHITFEFQAECWIDQYFIRQIAATKNIFLYKHEAAALTR